MPIYIYHDKNNNCTLKFRGLSPSMRSVRCMMILATAHIYRLKIMPVLTMYPSILTPVLGAQKSTICDFLSRNKKNIFEYALLSMGLVKHIIKTMELLMDGCRGEAGGPDRHPEISDMIIGFLNTSGRDHRRGRSVRASVMS